MRVALALAALSFATGATAPQEVPLTPAPGATHAQTDKLAETCLGRIEKVRKERGQPTLQRDTKPEEGRFIAAVDHRIDGCSVMLTMNDTSDVRPVPRVDTPAQVMRAR